MRLHGIHIAFVAGLAGCSAVDVGPEVGLFATATSSTSESARAFVGADPRAEREARLDSASVSSEARAWQFRGNCAAVPQAGDNSEVCQLVRDKGWTEAVAADAVRRKLTVIETYVAALSDLATAESDAALLKAYAAAVSALGDLATAAEAEALQKTNKALKERENSVSKTATFLLANRRAQLLRTTVLDNREAFKDVVQEIMDAVSSTTQQDDELIALFGRLNQARLEASMALERNDRVAYRRALDKVDRLHSAYMDARDESIFMRLSALAAAHEALAERLKRPASLEEIQAFTRALADLKVAF